MTPTKSLAQSILCGTLLLASCNRPPQTSLATEGSRLPLGLYQITFSGGGGTPLSATALRVAPGLGSQSLTAQSDLGLTVVSRSTVDAGGKRYVQATFQINNTSGTALTYLTFVGAQTANTLNNTAISQLNLFDGSAANPALIQQVMPTNPVTVENSTVLVQQNTASFQALSETEVAALSKTAGVLDYFPYGFVARNPVSGSRTLAAGSTDGRVTFALKLPLQAASRDDPFTISFIVQATTDNTARLTYTPEDASNMAGLQQRIGALKSQYPNAEIRSLGCLPGAASTSFSTIRTAGSAATPLAHLTSPSLSKPSLTPSGSGLLARNTPLNFGANFGQAVATTANGLLVRGSLQGVRSAATTGSGSGSLAAVSPSFFAGELVTLTVPRSETQGAAGEQLCDSLSAQYRVNSAPQGAAGFAAKTDYASGTNPVMLISADVNGDSKLDLITVNQTTNTVSVLLGNGDGTFQAKTDYASGAGSLSLVAADVNGDGRLDLITTNQSTNTVSVLLGNGDGTFQAKTDYPTGVNPVSVSAADVNGDGKLDLITADFDTNTVSVLLGNGNGSFQAKTDYAVGTNPQAVIAVDLNGDGKLDLATVNTGANTASVLLGNGDGSFQSKTDFATGAAPQSVTAADVNGDGHLDLLTADNSNDAVSMLLGNGNGSFQARIDYATGSFPQSVTAADINGDGQLDLVTANYGANTASVLLGNGDGSFQNKVDYPTGNFPTAVTAADVNGDGKLDLVTANDGSSTASVLLKN